MAVQACHAAIEVGRQISPEREHPHLVVCGIDSEFHLNRELSKIQAMGIRCYPFYEPDIGGQLTAFATEPLSGAARRYFRRFQLLAPGGVSAESVSV